MKTLSLDVRKRILNSYDRRQGTRAEVAEFYGISLGMVKKLLQQRRRIGDLAPQHHRAGRKPIILSKHRAQFQSLLRAQADMTLAELRSATGLNCSLPAIFYVLADMGLTYKKRHFGPASKTGLTSRRRGRHGGPNAGLGT